MNLFAAIEDASNLIILVSTLSIVIPAPFILTISANIKFKQKENTKMLNLKSLLVLYILQFISIVTLLLCWIFLFIEIGDGSLNKPLFISFTVLTFIIAAFWYAFILLFSQYIWISFEEEKITTFADSLKISKIDKIIKDTNSKFIYINWIEGSRTIKKLKISRESVLGQFVLENIENHTDKKVIEESQNEYYREQLLKIKSTTISARNNSKSTVEENKKEDQVKKPDDLE